ncbi:MAG: UvrD-helicase domain-containing protein [Planctomycetia bacterium]|nr:UvrD-helicase domain-containing protein [Planctomycetia bacterium]
MKNQIIRASAGTGKTYQLSRRFLQLLFAGERLDTILATTFTKKAAGEILFRVLSALAEGAESDEGCRNLAKMLELDLTLPQVQKLLGEVLQSIHRLNVSTLDSHFYQSAQCFSLELGLPAEWTIMEEDENVRFQQWAISQVLQRHQENAFKWMLLLNKGESKRSIHAEMMDIVRNMYPLWLECPPEAWEELGKSLKRTISVDGNQLLAMLQTDAEVVYRDQKSIRKALEKLNDCLAEGAWETLLESTLAMKAWDASQRGETAFVYGNCKKNPIADGTLIHLQQTVEYAREQLFSKWIYQLEKTQDLLAAFHLFYDEAKRRQGQLLFNDIPRLLTQTPFLQRKLEQTFRMDRHLHHLLLDEFQDTSPDQWRVLRPLAQRSAQPLRHRSFFCVGDVKQAIYGWRGGCAEIFDLLENDLFVEEESELEKISLDASFRSGQAIMEVTNDVFSHLLNNPALSEKDAPAARAWFRRFQKHQTNRDAYASYAELRVVPWQEGPEEEESGRGPGKKELREMVYQYTAQRVQELAEATAEANLSIGILVRTNEAASRMAHLLKMAGLDCSEEGSSPLLDSPQVSQILALFQWIDHPGNRWARYEVCQSELRHLFEGMRQNVTGNWLVSEKETETLERFRTLLLREGYGKTLESWVPLLKSHAETRHRRRLELLVELAYRYDERRTSRTDDFVRFIESQKVSDATASRIRVMNYHQSKGLQFDMVFLPELDKELADMDRTKILYDRHAPDEPPYIVLRYVSENLRKYLPRPLREVFEKYRQKLTEESLCLLYVAMTRAVHGLYMFLEPVPKTTEKFPATFGGMLRGSLCPQTTLEERAAKGQLLYTTPVGNETWYLNPGRKVSLQEEIPVKILPVRIPFAKPSETSTSVSSIIATQWKCPDRNRFPVELVSIPWDMQSMEKMDVRLRGSWIHRWLEEISWLDENTWQEERFRTWGLALGVPADIVERSLPAFHKLLQSPILRKILTRPSPEWEVWREKPLAAILPVGKKPWLLHGSIDRLHLRRENQLVTEAVIFDYKTLLESPDRSSVHVQDTYADQMDAYGRLVAHTYRIPREKIQIQLLIMG